METKMASPNEQILALREKTGAGMMDCKKALTEAGGDFAKAVEALRKKGLADAAKKSTRTTKEGYIAAYVSPDGKKGAILELNCETDFVAKTADFQNLANELAKKAAEGQIADVAAGAAIAQQAVAKLGENITLKRFEKYQLSGSGYLGHYIHPVGFKKGAFIEVATSSDAVAKHEEVANLVKELGLQIVAMAPRWLKKEDVPAADVEKEKEIYTTQLKNEGKPEASIPKIVEGKVNKLFYQAFCLVEMVSMRDNKTPISKLIADAGTKAGGTITVKRFTRYQLGE